MLGEAQHRPRLLSKRNFGHTSGLTARSYSYLMALLAHVATGASGEAELLCQAQCLTQAVPCDFGLAAIPYGDSGLHSRFELDR